MSQTSTTAGLAAVHANTDSSGADELDFSQEVEAHRRFFNTGKTRDLGYRRRQLQALRRMLAENIDEITEAMHQDLGRHRQMVLFGDIFGSMTSIDDALDYLDEWAAPRRKPVQLEFLGSTSALVPQPKGVMLLITAWNFPVQFIFDGLSQMIAAGNCVIIKPSEVAHHVETVVARLIPLYLDKQLVSCICGAVPETTALLRERFDHILYTGNGFVGRIVHQAAAKHLTPVTLELGGKGPGIVSRHADLRKTAQRIVFSKFFNNGQICAAVDYVLVERAVEGKFIEALQAVLKEYPCGPLDKNNPHYSRIINTRHFDRIASLLTAPHNGQVLCGGLDKADRTDCFLPVTVVLNPDVSSKLMREEIFGPVLPIITVDSVDAAVHFVNGREKPLVCYVFTQDTAEAKRVTTNVLSGTGAVNECVLQFVVEGIPFGGVGESGMGRYHGIYGFDEFSHLKPVLDRGWLPSWADLLGPVRYPPHSDFLTKLLRAAILHKGPVMHALRTMGKVLGHVKRLFFLYCFVVGLFVTFKPLLGIES